MSAPRVKGWCPGAIRPMVSGDGLVVRVRPRSGRLGQDQAAGLAELALACGNGLIDLTARANLQMRGVSEASHPRLLAGLTALGLGDVTVESESRRNIIVTPFWGEGDGATAIAAALESALAADDAPDLPPKFGFAVDCGPTPVLQHASADIRLERGADGVLICRADGMAAGRPVTRDDAASVMMKMARWFAAQGSGEKRMRALLQRVALPAGWIEAPAHHPRAEAPAPGLVAAGALAGLEFGQMEAGILLALSRLGALRVTPWRLILIEGLTRMPTLPGLLTAPDDPLLRVIACTGAPGCGQAAQPTRAAARALAPLVPRGAVLHVSGCEKGCAHPAPTAYAITGRADGFDFIRNGAAKDAPVMQNIPAAGLRAALLGGIG